MEINYGILWRYFIELSVLIPVAAFSLMPVREYIKSRRLILITAVLMLLLISACAYFSALWLPKIREVMALLTALLFLVYFFAVKLSFAKKLFCFFNSLMLCAWSNFFTISFAAPYEVQNIIWYKTRLFTTKSAIVYVSLYIVNGLVFFRTLSDKIPYLLRNERLDSAWKFLFLLPSIMTVLLLWMAPIHPPLMIIGRIRPISIALIAFILFAIFMFYDIFWRITKNLVESANLRQENALLQMEAKRYDEIKNYMNWTRTMRHDFRQHMAVLTELARAGKISEILSYAEELNEKSRGYVLYCANNAVDAIISYYDNKAHGERGKNIKIEWNVNLPSELSVKESDFCALFGNLIENALNAVKKIKAGERRIKVVVSMLTEKILGISVENSFEGFLSFNSDGLPISNSKSEGHGLGLISVSNIVKKYGGSLKINTDYNLFRVAVILYC